MRFSLKYKLTLALLGGICVVGLCIQLLGQWSFDRGFLRYVNAVEKPRLELLAETLENIYSTQQNWDFLREQPVVWLRILASTLPGQQADPEFVERLGRRFKDGKFPPPYGLTPDKERLFEMRVLLFDQQKNLIFGLQKLVEETEISELKVRDEVIGYLGLAPQIDLSDIHQLEFVKQQKLAYFLIAAGIMLAAALVYIPLIDRMVRPVRLLTNATRELAAGRYDIRTRVETADELGQLSKDFNLLASTLQQNEKARRQWTADISHELRTPLAVLRGEIEALQDKIRDITPQTLETLHDEVMHLNGLVNDLYELSLSDLGALSYKKFKVDALEILQKAIASFEVKFSERNLRLTRNFSAIGPCLLLADPERLLQMFTNILENSLRYTESGGELRISTTTDQKRLTVRFEDSSPGVPDDDLPRLFDRMSHTQFPRNRAAGGAGLGLSICRNIVEAHKGTISAGRSALGGLALSITLPVISTENQ